MLLIQGYRLLSVQFSGSDAENDTGRVLMQLRMESLDAPGFAELPSVRKLFQTAPVPGVIP